MLNNISSRNGKKISLFDVLIWGSQLDLRRVVTFQIIKLYESFLGILLLVLQDEESSELTHNHFNEVSLQSSLFTWPCTTRPSSNVNFVKILRRSIREFFFGSRHQRLSGQLPQQLIGKLLMAMWDRHVLVLLVVARYRILEALRAQALLQFGGRCQINFIASDAFLGGISFKGEIKWEGIFSVLYSKWWHGL